MLKRIIAMMLCALTVVSVSACGGGSDKSTDASSGDVLSQTSEENSDAGTDESQDNGSVGGDETSKDVSEDVSLDTTDVVDKAGYEQFVEIAKIDKVLKERGFLDQGANSDYTPLNYDKMKAVWISQFDFSNVYCGNAGQRSEDSFTNLVKQAYDKLLTAGFNTVIVQVRPNADSFYPSAYYPWSYYVVGSYGKMGSYDPLKIMVEEAHARGLSFHAWINPMRGMSTANIKKTNIAYPISSWKQDAKDKTKRYYNYEYTHDNLNYLNIAYEEVRNNIISGAAEIVRYYDVDGVHMDDYFYFGEESSFDNVALAEAKKNNPLLDRQKFRYDNLNKLVSGIYSAVKAENKNVMFGISPAGNIDKMADTYYADVKTWLSKDGYVDYIMPQIYFGMEHANWGVPICYSKWSALIKNPNIKMIPGYTLIKVDTVDEYAGAGKNEWIENDDVLKKTLEYSVAQSNFGGFAMFSFADFFNPVSGAPSTKNALEIENSREYFTEIIKGEVIKY